jgi:transcriptional regulator with XRE-family HTH domain
MKDMDFEPGWELRWVRKNGKRLRGLRKERRISRKLLADEAGVNVSQINRTEAGQDIRLSTLLKICGGLGYRLEFVLEEICEEAGPLLTAESWRRQERRYAGLDTGKRWFG